MKDEIKQRLFDSVTRASAWSPLGYANKTGPTIRITQRSGDVNQGKQLALEGIERSSKRQRAIDPFWSELAYKYLLAYSAEHFSCFSVELVKAHAYAHGLKEPYNGSAWGQIVRRAIREDRIVYAGLEPSINGSRHTAPVRLWRKK